MSLYRVAYSSQIDPDDWARVTPAIVELDCGLHWQDSASFATRLSKADLAIFRCNAYTNVKMLHQLSEDRSIDFLRRSLVRACWSEDSHHVWHMEAELVPLFHRMFVAHSEYLSVFPREKAHWLPTSFNSFSIGKLLEKTSSSPVTPDRDIIFPFRRYPDSLTDRNRIADRIKQLLHDRDVKALIGEVGLNAKDQQAETCKEILNSFGVLNVSLREELNQRVFTAHALNRPLLCDYVSDIENVDLDLSSTVYFKRDLSDYSDKLDEFLGIDLEGIKTRDLVLRRHMHLHRVVEMINVSLNLDLRIQLPEIGGSEKPCSVVHQSGSRQVPYPAYSHLNIRDEESHRGLYGLYRSFRNHWKRRKAERRDIHHPCNVRRVVRKFTQ